MNRFLSDRPISSSQNGITCIRPRAPDTEIANSSKALSTSINASTDENGEFLSPRIEWPEPSPLFPDPILPDGETQEDPFPGNDGIDTGGLEEPAPGPVLDGETGRSDADDPLSGNAPVDGIVPGPEIYDGLREIDWSVDLTLEEGIDPYGDTLIFTDGRDPVYGGDGHDPSDPAPPFQPQDDPFTDPAAPGPGGQLAPLEDPAPAFDELDPEDNPLLNDDDIL